MVWNIFLFFHIILGIIIPIPTDFHIFQRGRYTTNQETNQPQNEVNTIESENEKNRVGIPPTSKIIYIHIKSYKFQSSKSCWLHGHRCSLTSSHRWTGLGWYITIPEQHVAARLRRFYFLKESWQMQLSMCEDLFGGVSFSDISIYLSNIYIYIYIYLYT